jgi:hypothetical protein
MEFGQRTPELGVSSFKLIPGRTRRVHRPEKFRNQRSYRNLPVLFRP